MTYNGPLMLEMVVDSNIWPISYFHMDYKSCDEET